MNLKFMQNKGFTLIELIVVIAIIAVLSSVVVFGVTQYIGKGKDANIQGNLAVLIPAGEVYYNINGSNGYYEFCKSPSVINAFDEIPKPDPVHVCSNSEHPGLCCNETELYDAWAVCAQLFSDSSKAFCVDSRGIKKEIDAIDCNDSLIVCQD
jgi:prepilin-type N-terminal cleavage/methylation domain-containing protein